MSSGLTDLWRTSPGSGTNLIELYIWTLGLKMKVAPR